MPGAQRLTSSWPKYEVSEPAATIRLSYSMVWADSPWCAVTVRALRSIEVTWPSTTVVRRCLRTTSRIGGAISPGERIPVATW